jgi:MFS family permease
MKKALAPVAALLFSVSILLAGQGLMGTLLPVRASIEDFSTVSIGIFGAGYFLGFAIGCLKGGELVQRVGHIRVFLAMAALASAAPLLHGLVVGPFTWSLLRLLNGFSLAVLYVVIESWLNEHATNENRGVVFSTYAMITLSVLAAGQMMTLLYDPTGLQLFAIAAVLISVAAIPVALSSSPSPELPETAAVDLRGLYAISPAGALGCLVAGFTNGAFWALAPVFTRSVSEDPALAAWFMTAAVLGGAAAQWPLGALSDHIGRRAVLITVSVGAAGVGASLSWTGTTWDTTTIGVLGACWGAAAFPLYTIAVAHTNDYAEPSQYVAVSGGLLLMYGLGATFGPVIAATFLTLTNTGMLFLYCMIVHLLLVAFVLYRRLVQRAPSEHPVPFADALAATQTASPVYEDEIAHDSQARQETTHGYRERHESDSHARFSGMSLFRGNQEESQ